MIRRRASCTLGKLVGRVLPALAGVSLVLPGCAPPGEGASEGPRDVGAAELAAAPGPLGRGPTSAVDGALAGASRNEIAWRDTAEGGNASGEHDCGGGRYHHYEDPAVGAGPQLHVVGVHGASGGQPIAVNVTRGAPAVLVLTAQESAHWVVTVSGDAPVERVILSGAKAQTVSVPPGTVVDDRSGGHAPSLGNGFQWPAQNVADLVVRSEAEAGRSLTSFRGCAQGRSFTIGQPGEIRPPHPRGRSSGATLPAGCASIGQESAYCAGLSSGKLVAVGLDSGAVCQGPAAAYTAFPSSLGWVGDHLYACDFEERGLLRISVLDGSVDVAPVKCKMATAHQGGLVAAVSLGPNSHPLLREFFRFASFEDVARRRAQRSFGSSPYASRVATNGDDAYFAWHSTNAVMALDLSDPGAVATIGLQGFNNWVDAIDLLDDGRLVISSHFAAGPPALLFFDRNTGAQLPSLPLQTAAPNFLLQGLDCVSRP